MGLEPTTFCMASGSGFGLSAAEKRMVELELVPSRFRGSLASRSRFQAIRGSLGTRTGLCPFKLDGDAD
jgi:hypothetical protein